MLVLILVGLAVAVLARPALAAYRVTRMGGEARRHYLPMLWHRIRWPWLARNCQLAYHDRYHRRRHFGLHLPFTTGVSVHPEERHKLRYPAARFRADEYGWTVTARTIPRVGRKEFAQAAQHLADGMGAHRVTVTQGRPGRVQLRVMRADPLAFPFGAEACPAGTFTATQVFPSRLLLGRDEGGLWRHLALPGVTGITVTGLPGAGKSTALASFLCQLAGSPLVDFVILDGKGSQEWESWRGRATVLDDDLEAAEDCLLGQGAEMRVRQGTVKAISGSVNGWKSGPVPDLHLRVIVLDECDRFLNVAAYKGSPKDEARVRAMGQLVSTMIRRGRSVLTLVVLATQLGLAEAFGNSTIRNNCALSVAFALRTREAAVAALGDAIRDFPDVCPTTHMGPEAVGVCTTTLRTGMAAFTRLRVPEITEEAAAARAAETAPALRPMVPVVALPPGPAVPVPAPRMPVGAP